MTDLVFLGTSSGVPTRQRNQSSLALRWDDGRVWIVDAGEAAQHRLQRTSLRPSAVDAILITHLHGDHVFGLPGLLTAIDIAMGEPHPVDLVGPRGIRAMITAMLKHSRTFLRFPLRWHELDGEADLDLDGIRVHARAMVHRMTCYGFVCREPDRPGKLDIAAARAAGVPNGPELGRLKRGEDIGLADGTVVRAADVVGEAQPGHCLAIMGDTADAGAAIDVAGGCDLLIHEATFGNERATNANKWKHCTAAQAAAYAARIDARHTILHHFSSRYTVPGEAGTTEDLLEEARAAAPGRHLEVADDLQVWRLSHRPGHPLQLVSREGCAGDGAA